ncbi:MAG: methyltransferase [Planctomycetota bacterium]
MLERAGLVERRRGNRLAPRVRVFPILGKFIATDLLSHRAPDQVFSLMLEQVYFVRNTSAKEGDAVLDLCTGSGVLALFAADRAASVVGVDLSPRAIAFAEFNRGLTAPEVPVEFREGSLFEPVEGRAFDLIVTNPPFEFVPEGETHFLHSDGGEDGQRVTRECLERAPRFLGPGGRFEIVTWSPGSHGRPLLVELLHEAFPSSSVEVHLLDVLPIEEVCERFRGAPGYDAWQRRLESRGLTHCHFVFARAEPPKGAAPELSILAPHEESRECHRIADAW